MRSGVANLMYWSWTPNLFLEIPDQLLLTHCRIPLSEGRKIFEYQTEADLLSEPGTSDECAKD